MRLLSIAQEFARACHDLCPKLETDKNGHRHVFGQTSCCGPDASRWLMVALVGVDRQERGVGSGHSWIFIRTETEIVKGFWIVEVLLLLLEGRDKNASYEEDYNNASSVM
jgi:hypothetical protein